MITKERGHCNHFHKITIGDLDGRVRVVAVLISKALGAEAAPTGGYWLGLSSLTKKLTDDDSAVQHMSSNECGLGGIIES